MRRTRKLLQKLASGQVLELKNRAHEELIRLRERKHYTAGQTLFGAGVNANIFEAQFLRRFQHGGETDFHLALADRQAALFYAGFDKIERFKEFIAGQGSAERERIVSIADAVLQNRFPIFTRGLLSYGDPPRWDYDPLAGKCAPASFYADIDYLNAGDVGDAKVVWEISRFQYVFDLGQAYVLTGDERYPRKFFEVIHSWSDWHRDFHGIAYCSALEFAFRINSLLWATLFFKQSPSLTPEYARDIYRLIYISARFIEDHLSRYFAPNTHLLGEAWGLYLAGMLFPEFTDGVRWRRLGREILAAELEKQFTPDGMHAELSVAYHAYALEFILSALILSERAGAPLPARFYERLRQMTHVLSALERPDGTWPNIGDQDGGRLHFLSRVHALDFRPFLEAACLFAGEVGRQACFGRWRESFWLAGAEYQPTIQNEAVPTASQYFRSSGIAVSRSRNGMFSVFQCGRFGYKDSPHSHADMLHLDISVGQDNYIVDPGTHVYTSDLKLRNEYRSAHRHNGPVFDGIQLADPTDPFKWLLQPDCAVTQCYLGTRADYMLASYKLRQDRLGSAEVSRAVLCLHDAFWVIRDRIDLDQPRRLHWLFTTCCPIRQRGPASVLRGQTGTFTILPEFSSILNAQRNVIQSQVSEDYLSGCPAFALGFETEATARAQALFLMVPLMCHDNPCEFSIARDRERTAITFTMGDDVIVLSAGSGMSDLGGFQTDADLAVLRRTVSGAHSCLLLNGSFAASQGDKFFHSTSRVRYADIASMAGRLTLETSEQGPFPFSAAESTVVKSLSNLAT